MISQKVKAEGIASLLDVPVMARDAVIGILALQDDMKVLKDDVCSHRLWF